MYVKICDFLYVGSANSIKYADEFDLIVNCTTDMREPKLYKQFIRLPIHDDPGDIDNAMTIINETGVLSIIHLAIGDKKHVLVHCYAGEQRSCALVACYLIRYRGMTSIDAIEYIKKNHANAFAGGVNLIGLLESSERLQQ